MGVREIALREQCIVCKGRGPIRARWIDINLGDDNIKLCTVVARDDGDSEDARGEYQRGSIGSNDSTRGTQVVTSPHGEQRTQDAHDGCAQSDVHRHFAVALAL